MTIIDNIFSLGIETEICILLYIQIHPNKTMSHLRTDTCGRVAAGQCSVEQEQGPHTGPHLTAEVSPSVSARCPALSSHSCTDNKISVSIVSTAAKYDMYDVINIETRKHCYS